jgi:RimJ/RimL family protein N-acetyltransferase
MDAMTTLHLTTARLVIRSPDIGDAPALNAAIHASAKALREWMPWARTLPTLEQTSDNLREAIAQAAADRDYRLLLFTHAGELAGSSGLHQVDWQIPKAELGYWAHQRFAGQGLISEAVAAITQHAHLVMGMRRVEIIVSDRNQRSWRIPERLGYTHEATLRLHRVNPDGLTDHTRIYASLCDKPQATMPWAALHAQAPVG